MIGFIMAAGEGTRMWPLTEGRPKPMIPIANKPIIEHILDSLVDNGIEDIVILIGYEGRKIIEKYGYKYRDARIRYEYQERRLGTGNAALYAEKYGDEIIFINGDLYFDSKAIREIKKKKNSLLAVFKEDSSSYGLIIGNENLEEIKEKVKNAKNSWINAGIYHFDSKIFSYLKKVKLSERGEIEITNAINLFAKEEKIKIVRFNGFWMDIGMPWDVLDATKNYLERIKRDIKGEVEDFAVIKGNVILGEGSRILSGTYIEGPVIIGKNCKIGPNAYIRPYTVIGDNCHIGNACEIKASVIMDGSKIPHFNYVGDSIIGENCNLGAGTKIANLRLDEKNIEVYVKGKKINTRRRKLGVIMGNNVHTGINASIDSGSMVGSNSFIAPGARIGGIVKKNSRVF